MKTLKLSVVAFMLLGAVACKKSNNTNTNSSNSVTTDAAADLVSTSLATNSSGAISGINDVTVSAQVKVHIDSLCGTTWADSVSRSISVSGYSYSYKAKYSYSVDCSGSGSTFSGTVDANSSYTDTYSGPRLSSTSSGSSDFMLAGLGQAATVYTLNGEYKRSGSFQSKVDSTYAGTQNIDIAVTNLVFSKPQREIQSGSATFTISGDMPKRGSFSYTGTIVFNGGNAATLTVNGTVYMINLATGDKMRK